MAPYHALHTALWPVVAMYIQFLLPILFLAICIWLVSHVAFVSSSHFKHLHAENTGLYLAQLHKWPTEDALYSILPHGCGDNIYNVYRPWNCNSPYIHDNSVQGMLKTRYIRNSSAKYGKSGHIYVVHYSPWKQHQNVRDTWKNIQKTCVITVLWKYNLPCLHADNMPAISTIDSSRTFRKAFFMIYFSSS